jgi:hypothetical protein
MRWYFKHVYGIWDGLVPFYCDSTIVGQFAVPSRELAAGTEGAIFRLFVLLSMYQALRDEVIKKQQRSFKSSEVQTLSDMKALHHSIVTHNCSAFLSASAFENSCDVYKDRNIVDCALCPGVQCHVKEATGIFNRMGDMGKLPSSAWLQIWKQGGTRRVLSEICHKEPSPAKRAELLVERFSCIHRVGRKLATMFVSALSTPALAPGLTPWFPEVDGNQLVVVDTNVSRAVDALSSAGRLKTYDARTAWIRDQAAFIDLHEMNPDVPSYSPRLVQQALYTFCSKSNRVARGDSCLMTPGPCEECYPTLCPLSPASALQPLRKRSGCVTQARVISPS